MPRACFVVASLIGIAAITAPAPARAATTRRVSVSSTGQQGNNYSWGAAVSADGRLVLLYSEASNLVPGDYNSVPDVFLHEPLSCTTERVSVSNSGQQANGGSSPGGISADGRFVAFSSGASNLVAGDTNGVTDVFVRDRLTGTTERVSLSNEGEQANSFSYCSREAISADGRYVAFSSAAANLVAGDTNGFGDAFVRDRLMGTTERVDVSTSGEQANKGCWNEPVISADGRVVAFASWATNLVPQDTRGAGQVFVRDTLEGITECVSVSSAGVLGNYHSAYPSLSGDGRLVAFESEASDLVPGDTNNANDIFVHDRSTGTTQRVNVSSAGEQGMGLSESAAISADGRFVAFESGSNNLVAGDTNQSSDAFVRDLVNSRTERASLGDMGQQAMGAYWPAGGPAISADGSFVAFGSDAANLVPGDTNAQVDAFLRDMRASPPAGLSITINHGDSCTRSRSVTLAMTFPAGCEQMRLREYPAEWDVWQPCVTEKPWVILPGDGTKKVCIQCRDAQGNLSEEACDYILLDTTPPTDLSITIHDRLAADITCTSTGSLVLFVHASYEPQMEMRFSDDQQTWSQWYPWSGSWGSGAWWTLSNTRGARKVWFQVRDWCGNVSASASDDVWYVLFDDVICHHKQRLHIEALAQRGVVSGCSVGPPLFCPDNQVTRAEMAKALCLAAGKGPLGSTVPTFCDVPKTHPYYGWIERLADPASWDGTPPTIGCSLSPCRDYCPASAVLRGQAAAFIVRATGRAPMASCSGVFADVMPSIWYCPYVERLADAPSWPDAVTVTNGCPCLSGAPADAKCYCPWSKLTRGQMAVFLVRAFGIPL